MAHVATSTDGPRTTVVLDGRTLGMLHQLDDAVSVKVSPVDGAPVYLAAATYADGVDLFERLTIRPAGDECFAGDMTTAQRLHLTAYCDEGGDVASLLALVVEDEGTAIWSLHSRFTFDELRQLHSIVGFALARMAVTR